MRIYLRIIFTGGKAMAKKNHPYQRYYLKVRPFLKSKREEFQMVGLNAVTAEDIWGTLTKNKWKRPQENIHLHELVADIVTFSSNQFMTFQMVEAYKSPNLLEPLSEEELKELFKE
jgi:hypothetical protein